MYKEQVSKDLIRILNDIATMNSTISKLDAAVFLKTSDQLINEKVAYLYNLIQAEASHFGQSTDRFYDDINLTINHYKQKLNMVFDEFYCQYSNIQNEIQEARMNREIALINYQKIVNEGNTPNSEMLKEDLKKKNEMYKGIVRKCEDKFDICKGKFEQRINDEFFIISNSLQVRSEMSLFKRLFNKLANIFGGSQRFGEIVAEYNQKVDNIDSQMIVNEMREDTINFITEILEIRGVTQELEQVS